MDKYTENVIDIKPIINLGSTFSYPEFKYLLMKMKFNLFVFFLLFHVSMMAQSSYNIKVGSYEYLSIDPPAGYVRSSVWSCDEGLELSDRSEVGAIVKVSHYFSGVAYVRCSYVYEYLGSYDNNYHAGTGTETYRISCIAGTAKISKTTLELEPGENYTLECMRSSNFGTPTWTSNNEGVAIVNENGKVTAVGPGNATIILDPIIADPCYCDVEVGKIDPTKIEIVPNRISLKEGEKGKLSYKLMPSGATTKVIWKSSNEDVATVSSTGQVIAISQGEAKITATTENGLSSYATIEVVPLPQNIFLSIPESLTIGYQCKLKPILIPEDSETSYTWSSEDPIVAVIDKFGVVKGRTSGTTTITVTTENGKTASERINIKSPSQGVDYRNVNIRINFFKDVINKSLNNIK